MKIIHSRKITIDDLSKLGENAQAKRQLRQPLLEAFDIYKSNVYYGIIKETEYDHALILSWYTDLCDLKDSAFYSVPFSIKKYVR